MKTILLFGAGKSASVLIEYLLQNATENNWKIEVVDADKSLIELKIKNHPSSTAFELDITNDELRFDLIKNSDIVISMMPPFLHILIAKDCINAGKDLLTASYADDELKLLSSEAEKKGILFLCEMGLDPGIDHMSAMKLIDEIKLNGGDIICFRSHCGGLVAPESDDNPWHYKISWNPRNVVLAGKAGAEYLLDNVVVTEEYETLFDAERHIKTGDESIGTLGYYPNRNSLPYVDLYQLPNAKTFERTTLRNRDFILGWKKIIDLKLTDETVSYNSDGLSIAGFFEAHFTKHELIIPLIDELKENEAYKAAVQNMLTQALLKEENIHDLKINEQGELVENESAGSTTMNDLITAGYDQNKALEQLYFLGIDDHETMINKGMISAADGLQFILEIKLALSPTDIDMIVMQHDIEYVLNDKPHQIISSLIVKGQDSIHTAMAKTVGLPLGIAAKLILNGTINLTGLHIPTVKEIYEPVLLELEKNGVVFSETDTLKF